MGQNGYTNYQKSRNTEVINREPQSQESKFGVVRCLKLRVRTAPVSDDENVIGVLSENVKVEIVETFPGWYKVKSGNLSGYVMREYVKEV